MNLCPKCGKKMSEQKEGSGFWTCPDFKTPINNAPPYKFKCTGMFIENHAVEEFNQACWEIVNARN